MNQLGVLRSEVSTVKLLIEYSAAWAEVLAILGDGRSSVLLAPKHYGQWGALEGLAKALESDPARRAISVSSRVPSFEGDIDYSCLWEAVRVPLGVVSKRTVGSRAGFLSAFKKALAERAGHLTIFLGGAGRGHEESHFRVVSVFQQLLGTGQLNMVAMDDYSSFYFQKANYLLSDIHSLEMVQAGPSGPEHIRRYLEDRTSLRRADAGYTKEVVRRVWEASGGHTGIAQELLQSLERNHWPNLGADYDLVIDSTLRNSAVLEHIIRALEEDTQGYCQTAMEYRIPTMPEKNSVRVQVLRQLGVLHRVEPPLLALCGGAITKIIEKLVHDPSPGDSGRLGSVITESGPRLFEEGPVQLTEDDLVLLHLSDLHVGDNYRYRLMWEGGQLNPNEPSAAELLREDLESLSLANRIDGVVFSGDFVWNGKPEEFRRAREVIAEILSAVNIDVSRALLIPGNHDVEWNPGNLSSRSYGKAVSRESYDDFVALLGNKMGGEVVQVAIPSRSGKYILQIVGVDSNRVEGPNAAGIGFVSRDSLAIARKFIGEFQASHREHAYTWLAVHHHVFPASSSPLADAERAKVSTMANAAEILEMATQSRCEIVLHGHEHQPCITVARRWPVDAGDAFAPTASVGAGSFGVKREYLGPFSRNQYFVLIRRPNGILLRSRAHGSAGVRFVAHSDLWLPR
jgi:3',5'-cyclic-AMP phosphodiesterase